MNSVPLPCRGVDFSVLLTNNSSMSITENTIDARALLERVSGKPLDPETYRRIRARQEKITADLQRQHGEMNIAVPLIREVRDEQ
jgi:hypothetical protein